MRKLMKRATSYLSGNQESFLNYLENSVKQVIKSNADVIVPDFDLNTSFQEMNFDILEKTRLIVEIEHHFNVNFTDSEFINISTPFDCVVFLNKHLASQYSLSKKESFQIKNTNN